MVNKNNVLYKMRTFKNYIDTSKKRNNRYILLKANAMYALSQEVGVIYIYISRVTRMKMVIKAGFLGSF
jgi:hypothetical protein